MPCISILRLTLRDSQYVFIACYQFYIRDNTLVLISFDGIYKDPGKLI